MHSSIYADSLNFYTNGIELGLYPENEFLFPEFLNNSAIISFYNLTNNYYIYKDGSICTTCSNVNFNNGTLSFNVQGIGNYSLVSNLTIPESILSVNQISPVTLSGGQITNVSFIFNVTGTFNSAQANFTHGNESRSGDCNSISIDEFNCTVSMYYYDSDGIWNVNVYAISSSNITYENSSTFFTINSLDFVNIMNSSFEWNLVYPNSTFNIANNQVITQNLGNQNYNNVEIKGFNATSNLSVLMADNFTISNESTPYSYVRMEENIFVNVSSILELPKGNTSTQTIYAYVDIPDGMVVGTYNGGDLWNIKYSN
jgi:hypothetical protein